MVLLGIDLGTTHLKTGLFTHDGRELKIVSRPHRARPGWEGILSYDPLDLWRDVSELLAELATWLKSSRGKVGPIQAIGIAGMAETGLLADANTGSPRTPFVPWFETCALEQAAWLATQYSAEKQFYQTGLRPGYKQGLVKLLWLQARRPELLPGAIWLSVPDYVAYRLTGHFATDYTLAERSGVFRIDKQDYDQTLLDTLQLSAVVFPQALPSGSPIGLTTAARDESGLPAGIPVSIAGHDHVCGAFAAASIAAGEAGLWAFDSMGTAEAMIGEFPERPLAPGDYHSGFSFGISVTPGCLYWQGGLSTSGGSLEWLRQILNERRLTYAEMEALLQSRGDAPTGILYFPYLAGSGSPHSNARARGAFLGLNTGLSRADLIQAVLEGCAYEMEWMRRKAEAVVNQLVNRVVAAGGGTRSRRWLQIKADVFGCPVDVLEQNETSLLGAALLAGLGGGVYGSLSELRSSLAVNSKTSIFPDPQRLSIYRRIFEEGYAKLEPVIQSFILPALPPEKR